jgi:hypothetical protein
MQIRIAPTRIKDLEQHGWHRGYMWVVLGSVVYDVKLYFVYIGIPPACQAKLRDQHGNWGSMQQLANIFGVESSFYGPNPFSMSISAVATAWGVSWCGMNHEYGVNGVTAALIPRRYCISEYRGTQPRTMQTTLQVGIEMCGRMADFHELD